MERADRWPADGCSIILQKVRDRLKPDKTFFYWCERESDISWNHETESLEKLKQKVLSWASEFHRARNLAFEKDGPLMVRMPWSIEGLEEGLPKTDQRDKYFAVRIRQAERLLAKDKKFACPALKELKPTMKKLEKIAEKLENNEDLSERDSFDYLQTILPLPTLMELAGD